MIVLEEKLKDGRNFTQYINKDIPAVKSFIAISGKVTPSEVYKNLNISLTSDLKPLLSSISGAYAYVDAEKTRYFGSVRSKGIIIVEKSYALVLYGVEPSLHGGGYVSSVRGNCFAYYRCKDKELDYDLLKLDPFRYESTATAKKLHQQPENFIVGENFTLSTYKAAFEDLVPFKADEAFELDGEFVGARNPSGFTIPTYTYPDPINQSDKTATAILTGLAKAPTCQVPPSEGFNFIADKALNVPASNLRTAFSDPGSNLTAFDTLRYYRFSDSYGTLKDDSIFLLGTKVSSLKAIASTSDKADFRKFNTYVCAVVDTKQFWLLLADGDLEYSSDFNQIVGFDTVIYDSGVNELLEEYKYWREYFKAQLAKALTGSLIDIFEKLNEDCEDLLKTSMSSTALSYFSEELSDHVSPTFGVKVDILGTARVYNESLMVPFPAVPDDLSLQEKTELYKNYNVKVEKLISNNIKLLLSDELISFLQTKRTEEEVALYAEELMQKADSLTGALTTKRVRKAAETAIATKMKNALSTLFKYNPLQAFEGNIDRQLSKICYDETMCYVHFWGEGQDYPHFPKSNPSAWFFEGVEWALTPKGHHLSVYITGMPSYTYRRPTGIVGGKHIVSPGAAMRTALNRTAKDLGLVTPTSDGVVDVSYTVAPFVTLEKHRLFNNTEKCQEVEKRKGIVATKGYWHSRDIKEAIPNYEHWNVCYVGDESLKGTVLPLRYENLDFKDPDQPDGIRVFLTSGELERACSDIDISKSELQKSAVASAVITGLNRLATKKALDRIKNKLSAFDQGAPSDAVYVYSAGMILDIQAALTIAPVKKTEVEAILELNSYIKDSADVSKNIKQSMSMLADRVRPFLNKNESALSLRTFRKMEDAGEVLSLDTGNSGVLFYKLPEVYPGHNYVKEVI